MVDLAEARKQLVKKYRANPQVWPDGIDSKYDRWYTGHEHEWLDDGTYVGAPKMSTSGMSTSGMSTSSNVMSTSGGKRDWAALKRKQRARLVEAR